MTAKGWIMQDEAEPSATAHGSLHDYDQQVPVILLPPGHTLHTPQTKPADGEIQITQIAPMLARWLGVTPPTELRP
jgi:hypothetical protein